MRELSTDEPCGLGIVGDASRSVTWLLGWRLDRDRAVDTSRHCQLGSPIHEESSSG
jgi:hypothetical protein